MPTKDNLLPSRSLIDERMALIGDIKKFQSGLGLPPTDNFLEYAEEVFCYPAGYTAPEDRVPYSYEDPVLTFHPNADPEKFYEIAKAENKDAFFYNIPALAHRGGTPATPLLMWEDIERFLYVVFHEDYHEIITLPPGIEEPACNLISMELAKKFALARFGDGSREYRRINGYSALECSRTKIVLSLYRDLNRLCFEYRRGRMTTRNFRNAKIRLCDAAYAEESRLIHSCGMEHWYDPSFKNPYNNVFVGFTMTYKRHLPLLERIFNPLDGNVSRITNVLRLLSREKPAKNEIKYWPGSTEADKIRLYERAIIRKLKQLIAQEIN